MDKLLERFCRYVKVETTAVEVTDDYPSSPGQHTLGKMLVEELGALELDAVGVDQHGIVTATIPANVDGAPAIAWLAHMDTSPEYTAHDVKPVIHENYDGKDIHLPGDKTKVIEVAETDGLAELKGKTIISTDGTTLLGADDKSGIAVIMTTAEELMAQPNLKHGPIRIVFTCDEEVGRGCAKIDIDNIDAVCAYTLDGEAAGMIENETFSADLALVTVRGRNIHPGLAKDKMVNAIRLAGIFLSRLPMDRLAPEVTAGREPFVHPYVLQGGVDEASIRILLRSFDTADLANQAAMLRDVAASVISAHPKAKIDVAVTTQYRNMAEGLDKEPRAVELAAEAMRAAGIEPKFESIRGGTDGSRLTEMGLPTPNLSTGMHNFHSPLEFACLEQMQTAVKVLVELAQTWGRQKA